MSVMIQVAELGFSTEDGIKVLEDVHLRVDRGELVFLSGPPSAGKSLLLGLLAGHIPPQHGQILVYGRNVARLNREKRLRLRQQIGFLPQGFTPLPRTVLENVTFKLRALGDFKEQGEEKAMFALETVGLLREQTTDAEELTSLERVKLGLAIAICDDPLLLLADGPFDGLTPEDQSEVCGLLERINRRGVTVLVAGRDPLPPPAHKHRVLRMVDGTVNGG